MGRGRGLEEDERAHPDADGGVDEGGGALEPSYSLPETHGGRRRDVGDGVVIGAARLELAEGIVEAVVGDLPRHSCSPCRARWPRGCSSATTSCTRWRVRYRRIGS